MTPEAPNDTPLLLTATKSNFGGLRVLFLLCAIALMAAQLVYSFQGNRPETLQATQFLPVGLAVVCFLLFLIIGKKGGEIQVYRDRLQGKRSMGTPFQIPIQSISVIEFANKRLAIKDFENKLLLVESPKNTMTGGLIWLLKEYQNWPEAIWNNFSPVAQDSFPRATRYFLGDDGAASFGDNGFLVQIADQQWYMPATSMFPIVGRTGEPNRIYSRPQNTGASLFLIDPNPADLPLAALCAGVLATSSIDQNAAREYLADLAENHGGNLLGPMVEAMGFAGDYNGYSVLVAPVEG